MTLDVLGPAAYRDSMTAATSSAASSTDRQIRWGARVARRRDELGMSRYRLAIDAGIGQTHLARIETGDVNAGDDTRIAIARVLKCRVEDLWDYPDIAGGD
jgi:DNA-binding XRE family transcriptional regulator